MSFPGLNFSQRHPGKALALVALLALAAGLHMLGEYNRRPPLPEPTPGHKPSPLTENSKTETRLPDPPRLPAENLFASPGLQTWLKSQWILPSPTPVTSGPTPIPLPLTPTPAPTPVPAPVPTPVPLPVTRPVSVRYAGSISRLDGHPRALLALTETNEDFLLFKGDLWRGYRATEITPDFLRLEKNGRVYILPLDVPTPLDQP